MIILSSDKNIVIFEVVYDILLNGKIQNEIIIEYMSEGILDKIIIENGKIQFGDKTFNIVYFTDSIDHTFSVLGQFVYFLEDWLKGLK